MAACVVMTAVKDRRTARWLGRRLVEAKLAACVTALAHAESCYRWKGRVERSAEILLLIKTDRRLWKQIAGFFRKNHPYELPELVAVPIEKGSKEYLSWIASCLKK